MLLLRSSSRPAWSTHYFVLKALINQDRKKLRREEKKAKNIQQQKKTKDVSENQVDHRRLGFYSNISSVIAPVVLSLSSYSLLLWPPATSVVFSGHEREENRCSVWTCSIRNAHFLFSAATFENFSHCVLWWTWPGFLLLGTNRNLMSWENVNFALTSIHKLSLSYTFGSQVRICPLVPR